MSNVLLKTENIAKEFSGVRVLNDINIEINKGEIFGVIGENGAGKSTLIKILNGIHEPTEGKVFFENEEIRDVDTEKAMNLGIHTIPQEFNLVNDLNVYENIFLGQEYKKNRVILNKTKMKDETKKLLNQLEKDIDPEAKIENLSVAQKQMVEIAKAIAFDTKLLIMDEPTTVLTPEETKVLFDLMKKLKKQGVTLIFISHRLEEIKKITDRVMVLRDGEQIDLKEVSNISEHEMAEKMVGRELSQMFPDKLKPDQETVLEVKNLSVNGLLSNINFDLKKGEILGFAGLVGAGRTELAETIIGIRNKDSGEVYIKGEKAEIKNVQDALDYKISYLPEDRQGTGILTNFDVISNTTLSSLDKYTSFLINHNKTKEVTKEYVDFFNIKAPSLQSKLEYLSGGNQQKVSLAKSLDIEPEIFIFDEPTRGIDVSAKREIYQFINELVDSGISCIVISSEIEEIMGLSNRVVVMHEGEISGILTEDQINENNIMYYATGLEKGEE